jgi:hypothetical protein
MQKLHLVSCLLLVYVLNLLSWNLCLNLKFLMFLVDIFCALFSWIAGPNSDDQLFIAVLGIIVSASEWIVSIVWSLNARVFTVRTKAFTNWDAGNKQFLVLYNVRGMRLQNSGSGYHLKKIFTCWCWRVAQCLFNRLRDWGQGFFLLAFVKRRRWNALSRFLESGMKCRLWDMWF